LAIVWALLHPDKMKSLGATMATTVSLQRKEDLTNRYRLIEKGISWPSEHARRTENRFS
jgi:hypothetical protein